MPDQSHFYRHIRENAPHSWNVVTPDSRAGKTVVICGAGPSLAHEYQRLPDADEVWACNSALPYLMDRGVRVTHGFAIDQGEAMLGADEWGRTFDVDYLVASSVSPKLVQHLLDHERTVTFFHNHLGIADPEGWKPPEPGLTYELWLYTLSGLYGSKGPTKQPRACGRTGHGLNSVPRAICLALGMGFDRILVYGADCGAVGSPLMPPPTSAEYAAWLDTVVLYADGRTALTFGPETPMAEARNLDGRRWHSRPDMIISAAQMVELDEAFPGRITYVGETMVNALRGQSQAFLADLPKLTPTGEVVGFGNASLAHQPKSSSLMEQSV